MADKTYVFKAQYDTEDAVKSIEKLSKAIIAEQANLKELTQKLKDGKISQVDYATAVAEQTHSLNRDIQERKKYINVIQAEIGSVKRAKAENQILREERNKMVLSDGKNSASVKKLNAQIDGNTKIIKNNVDSQSRWYMGAQKAKEGLLLLWAAIGIGVVALKKFAVAIKDSSELLSDKYDRAVRQAGDATSFFLKSLSTGEIGNLQSFWDKLKGVVKTAGEVADAFDRLEDIQRSYDVKTKETRIRIAELDVQYREGNRTVKEREALLVEMLALEKQIADEDVSLKQERLNETLKELSSTTQLTSEQLLQYVKNFKSLEPLMQSGDVISKKLKEIRDLSSTHIGSGLSLFDQLSEAARTNSPEMEKARKEMFELMKGLTGSGLTSKWNDYYNEFLKFASVAGSEWDRIRDAIIGTSEAQSSYNETTRRDQVKLAEFKKNNVEREKAYIDEINLKMIESGEILNQATQDSEDKQIASLGKIHEQWRKNLFERKELSEEEEEARQKRLENSQLGLETGAELESLFTQKKMQDLDTELNKIQYNRDKEIAAAEKAGRDTTAIKEKYQKQENKIKEKQWKTQHKHDIIQSIINTALAVTESLANPAKAIAVGIIGAIQTGIIASREMPKFKEGTKGKLKKATYAEIGDGYKRELVVTPDGSYLSDSRPTKAFLPEGSQVFSGEKTEQIMKENVLSDSLLSQMIIEERLTRKALIDRPEVHNQMTSHGMIKYTKIHNMIIHSLKERFS